MKTPFENSQVSIDQIPTAREISWTPVETRLRSMIVCGNLLYLIPCSPIVILGVAGWLTIPEDFSELDWLYQLIFICWGAVTIVLALLTPFFLFLGYVAPFLEVPRRSYSVSQEDLSYRRGLFKNVVSTAPFKRIQHASTHRKLFERMFNLSSLEVFTAAGRAFRIQGLSPNTAEDLRDHVLEQISKFQVDGNIGVVKGAPETNGNQDLG